MLVEDMHNELAIIDSEYKMSQLKEKFASLSIYFEDSANRDLLYRVSEKYIERSTHTCMDCGSIDGEWGCENGNNWIVVKCLDCQSQQFSNMEGSELYKILHPFQFNGK